jgi:4-amino-4-deoxy-L-arabinose transferase-like glycosyltransferase
MALNLQRHGVMSLDEIPPYQPSSFREPVPIAAIAATVAITDAWFGKAEPSEYFSGARARYLKLVNLWWLVVLATSAFLAIRHFTASFLLALLGGVLVALHFTSSVPIQSRATLGVDNLDTELAGAALLSAACLLLAVGLARRSRWTMTGAGLCFGLAALTKAALFYSCLSALVCFFAWCTVAVLRRRPATPKVQLGLVAALVIPFLLLTLAWQYRNYVQTGYFQIAERSGSVLLHRALIDEASAEEVLGMLTVWGDPHVDRLIGRFTGFGPADLGAGRPLQRVSEYISGDAEVRERDAEDAGRPDATITWYRRARATYEAKRIQFAQQGVRYPSGAANEASKREAFALIIQRPIKHAAMMLPLMWRGAPRAFLVLAVAFVYAWRRGRADVALFVLPAIFLALFYAAASQFERRFGFVIDPIATVAALVLLAAFLSSNRLVSRTPRARL